jgi:hypothetical protein
VHRALALLEDLTLSKIQPSLPIHEVRGTDQCITPYDSNM